MLAPSRIGSLAAASATTRGRRTALEARVADQRAIEQFYWARRIWPDQNPGPKPAFEVSVPDDLIRRKAEDGLLKSEALRTLWSHAITPADLQHELDRMARDTRDATGLRELWAALGDDPHRIAESLARPILADRLIRTRYAFDRDLHGSVEAQARQALASRGAKSLRALDGEYHEAVIDRTDHAPVDTGRPKGNGVREQESALAGLAIGQVSELMEDQRSFFVLGLLERSADRVRFARVSWPKQAFDAWWDSERTALTYRTEVDQDAEAIILPTVSQEAQTVGTWAQMDAGSLLGRQLHTAVWTGSEMLVWGGLEADYLDDGGRYDPATDSWSPITRTGAPSPRSGHAAFWSGSRMLVWGGSNGDWPGPGGIYDPATDTWAPMSGTGAPDNRADASAVWNGTDLIVWGGYDTISGLYLGTGASYRSSTNTWTAISNTGAPTGRGEHTAVWAGNRMIVWGGVGDNGFLNDGGIYNPTTNTWASMSTSGAPSGRILHSATWTGTEMVIWGGEDDIEISNSGARYRLQNNHWSAIATTGAPSAREDHTGVWTGSRVLVWGGWNGQAELGNGALYDPGADAWTPMASTSAPSPRESHTAVWSGSEMLVWGGEGQYTRLDSGARYNPSSNSWIPMAAANNLPEERTGHASVWTGSELIVWGGSYFVPLDGGRYDPVTDQWTPTSTSGEPSHRYRQTAIWTGNRMIVWGGERYDPVAIGQVAVPGGGLYDPVANSWTTTNTVGEPSARSQHTAVWTGNEMIVWGGWDFVSPPFNTGGRYDPTTNHWTATTVTGAPGPNTTNHSAVWTGTEMIVWGGQNGTGPVKSGARYRPDLDRWRPTSEVGVIGRVFPLTVWSGKEMIVWGGFDETGAANTGSRYDPVTNTWQTIATAGAPPHGQTAQTVWACGKMFAWGLEDSSTGGTLAAYDAGTNAWTPLSHAGAPFGTYSLPLITSGTQLFVFGGASRFGYITSTGGVYQACAALPALSSGHGLSVVKSPGGFRIAWFTVDTATGYDLVRGDLGLLKSTGGDFAAATQQCLLSNSVLTGIDDSVVPAVNQGLWYLSRPRRTSEVGTYDSGSPSQVGLRDAEIAASGMGCP